MPPNGQHRPYMGKARAWFVESVISPIMDCTTAALPENKPAGGMVSPGVSILDETNSYLDYARIQHRIDCGRSP